MLYGRHAVLESLRAQRRRVHRIWIGEGVRQSGGVIVDILSAAESQGCPVVAAGKGQLDRLGPVNHQGVVAEAADYPYVSLPELLGEPLPPAPLFLLLDHLQDVQNLGTLLRTAEAMAVTAVLLPERRSAAVTPAVVNASSGAVEHLRIALVVNLVQAMEQLKSVGCWLAGLDASAEAITLAQAKLTGCIGIVVGAEGAGVSRLVREHCDWLVRIPMYGRVDSLNAAVAGSIALVAARQMQAAAATGIGSKG